jgi:hypothetical protein
VRTKNEKILLAVLLAVVFLGANYYGYQWLLQKQKHEDFELQTLKADKAVAATALQELPLWAQRKAWISEHQPAITGDEGTAKADVLESVLKGARDNKLEIVEQSLNDVTHGASGTRVNVSVKVKGSMQDLVKWLTVLENPTQFYAVSVFSLKADQDQKSMVCTLQIARYFKGGGGTSL